MASINADTSVNGTNTGINGVLDVLSMVLEFCRYFSRLAGKLTSFGRAAFDPVIYVGGQGCGCFLAVFRREQDGKMSLR